MKVLALVSLCVSLLSAFAGANPAANTGGCELVSCPDINPEYALHLPNPLECTSFCHCDWGVAYYKECPISSTGPPVERLHFNAALQVCDWPESAGCTVKEPEPTEEPPKPTTAKPPKPTTQEPEPETEPPTEEPETETEPPVTDEPETEPPATDPPKTTTTKKPNPITTTKKPNPITTTKKPTTPEPTTPKPTTHKPTGCEKVTCPAENGEFALHLPNPDDCGSFCKCDWGQAIWFDCPGDLHFNAELQVCDWPANAGCDPNLTTTTKKPLPTTTTTKKPTTTTTKKTTTTSTTTAKPTGCEKVTCPAENGEFALHLPNPDDCGSFCKCDWGVAYWFDCPGDLHFNAELQVCDWPGNAGCDPDLVKPTTTTTKKPTTTTKKTTTTSTTTAKPTGCEKVTCPAENGEFALHLPNPDDCGSFCKCDWGQAIWFDCPGDLHFNAELQVCDWPGNAGCDPDLVKPTTTTTTTKKPTTTTKKTTTTSTTTAKPTGCEKVTCPAENGEFALHLPNPDDCGSFCKCDWGVAYWFDCPGDLHFNAELQVCDWPGNAGCDPDLVKPTTTTTTTKKPTTTTKKTTTTSTTTAKPTGCEKVTCPAENGEFALHLPNPDDCGSFCKCDWGQAIWFDCPGDLHFNAELQVCDWPGNAGCDHGLITPNTTTTTTTAKPTGCDKVTCPAENGEFALHLPNPDDCGSFCKCDWGTAYYFDCPGDLHFNAELQVCDWPGNAGCDPDLKPPTTTTTKKPLPTTTKPKPTPAPTTQKPVGNGCELVTCPAQNGEFALHLPNPLDCGSFCKCDWGVAYYFDCPDGLHFNAELQVCDWPQNAGCQVSANARCAKSKPGTLLASNVNCNQFFVCDHGKARTMHCPANLYFNEATGLCDYPANVKCSVFSKSHSRH